jgi:hypothetical protein
MYHGTDMTTTQFVIQPALTAENAEPAEF